MSACAHKRFAGDAHVTTHCQAKPQIVVLAEELSFVESTYLVNQTTFGNDGGRGDDSVDAKQGLNDGAFIWYPLLNTSFGQRIAARVDRAVLRITPAAVAAGPHQIELNLQFLR